MWDAYDLQSAGECTCGASDRAELSERIERLLLEDCPDRRRYQY